MTNEEKTIELLEDINDKLATIIKMLYKPNADTETGLHLKIDGYDLTRPTKDK